MIEVSVSINAAVLYCDETALEIQLGNGYSFAKKISILCRLRTRLQMAEES